MKTKLGLLLLMLLITVGCDDSAEIAKLREQVETLQKQATEPSPEPSFESITNTVGMTFKAIPAGIFMMGSPDNEDDMTGEGLNLLYDEASKKEDNVKLLELEKLDVGLHQHKVTITKAFYMQTTEVTQGQWKSVMGTEPWKGEDYVKEGVNYAASIVSWDDAVAFCKNLSEKEGKTYRLPTEAEWEYACRAGTTTKWSFGDDEKQLGNYAWHLENTFGYDTDDGGYQTIGEGYAHQVRQKKPNAFGLYDMHGNVYEWCHDYFEENYYKQSPEKDPTGPASGSLRVLRGGSWIFDWFSCSSIARMASSPDFIESSVFSGFRVVRELDDSERLRMQAAAITTAIGKGDWETVLALDATNSEGLRLLAAAITAAIGKGDWETVLALDATNSEGLRLLAAAITAAIGKGDWETVLALDPDNEAGTQLKAAAVAAALAKGDWKAVLALDATNSEGLRMQAASEKAVILARAPITNTISMKFNKIPAGTFMMGSPETEPDRESNEQQHKVTIRKAFYMQTTEVTQGQWKAVMRTEPWKGQEFSFYVKEGPNYPAVYVSWDDAIAYCKILSEKEGKTYRLPTEAEWEYACRAETQTTWNFGNDEKELGDYAWYNATKKLYEQYARQVGLKKPNAFGLYDMHGNVYEWCSDYYGEDYYEQSPAQDPTGPASGSYRILRGGSWFFVATRLSRSAFRGRIDADSRDNFLGFRLVRELD